MTESEVIEILRFAYPKESNRPITEEVISIAINALDEIQQYKELGTVEELRLAKEKQIAKKPIFANNMMTKDKFLMCPCCEFRFPDSLVFLKTRCWNCGQKLDWSDEE